MKINFDAVITNLKGNAMRQSEHTESPPATLAWVASEALLHATNEKDGGAKYKLFALALKIGEGGEVDLKPEEVALIKDKIGTLFGPLIVGRAYDMLNG